MMAKQNGFLNRLKNFVFGPSQNIQQGNTPNNLKAESKKTSEYSIDHDIVFQFFRKDPLINAAVNVTVDNVCSDGFYFKKLEESEEAERQKEAMEKFARKDNWNDKNRNITANLVVFDDCYREILEQPNRVFPTGTSIIDTRSIKIRLDEEQGNIESYEQHINGNHVADLDPEDIIHYRLNTFGDRDYGLSLMESVIYSASVKRFAEKYAGQYFENMKPRMVWKFPQNMSKNLYNETVDNIIDAKDNPQKDLYLRGTELEVDKLTNQEDMEFSNLLSYLRTQIITAMLVPPIMLGIPEGSNKSNSDIQLQAFDRRVKAIQEAIEYKTNEKLIKKKFGFDKIEFKFDRANKRDTQKEVDIARKMKGFATMNEIREAVGLPKLDSDEFPEAEEILTEGGDQDQRDVINDALEERKSKKKVTKTRKGENPPKENPIKESEETKLARVFRKYIRNVKKEAEKQIEEHKNDYVAKQASDPEDMVKQIMAGLAIDKLRNEIQDQINSAFEKGLNSAQKEVNQNITADSEVLEAISNMSFDLAEDMAEEMRGKLRQVLRRGQINQSGINAVKEDIKSSLKVSENRAETIARTEMQRAGNTARLGAYRQAGIKKVKWVAQIDSRTSQICRNLDGQVQKVNDLFKTEANGDRIRVKNPPAHPNCRSTVVPLIEE